MTVSPFNAKLPLDTNGRPVPTLHPSSTTIMARVASWTGIYPLRTDWADTTSDFNHPVFFAKATDPQFTVARGTTGGAFESGGPHIIRIPQVARPARGGDGHMCVIQPDGVSEWDLWDVTTDAASNTRLVTLPGGGAGGTIYARGLGKSMLNGSGLNTGNGDATAAMFGLLAGVIRGEEMEAQKINHALFVTIKGHNNTFVEPALASGGTGGYDGSANAPPMGARFFLDYSQAEIEALSVPRYRKTILHALREYGMYAGDAGGSPMDIHVLSGTTYTALGLNDKFKTYMSSQGVTGQVDWRSGVDWSKLKVASPVTAQAWPTGWPAQPVRPAGLTQQTGGTYNTTASNREYINLGSGAGQDVKTSPTATPVSNVIIRNTNFSYLQIENGTNNFWLENSVVGMGSSITIFNITNKSGLFPAGSTNVVLDGVTIKDAVRTSADTHIEGLHATCCTVLWIKNCTFRNNSLGNIRFQNWGTDSLRYVLVEDCVFERPVTPDPFVSGAPFSNISIDDNPSLGSPREVIIRNSIVKGVGINIDPIARSQGCKAYNNRNESGVLLPDIGTP